MENGDKSPKFQKKKIKKKLQSCKVAEEISTKLQSCMENGDKSSKLEKKKEEKVAKWQKKSVQNCKVAWKMETNPQSLKKKK